MDIYLEKYNEDIDYITQVINAAKSNKKWSNLEINNEIHRKIYEDVILYRNTYKNVDISNYISNLDKTRIKTPEEYYSEFMNAPFYNIRNGTPLYSAPERFMSKYKMDKMEKNKNKKFEAVKINPSDTTEHIIAPIKPLYEDTQDECNYDINMPLDEMVSLTYLKHMYNRPLLDSCRSLIKFKIIHGEMLSQENILFLSKIDKYLYRIYLERHNLAAKNIKTKARRNKKTKARRNKKTKKI